MPDPIFVLAPGRSFTSVITAMLGQHPQTYGMLELNLNVADTVRDWWTRFRAGQGLHARGLLRTVAYEVFGDQTEETVVSAWKWLGARLDWTTAELHQTLCENVAPRHVAEKCPVGVNDDRELERLVEAFPNARFLHLLRHPRGNCASFTQTDWARQLLIIAFPQHADLTTNPPSIDPQPLWYETHIRIERLLSQLPREQWMRVRGEDVLEDPATQLRDIVRWIGLRDDDAAIEDMLHPERSPYSRVGPSNAIGGADMSFLESPALRPYSRKPESLEGPLAWRADGGGFLPEVKDMARGYGYE